MDIEILVKNISGKNVDVGYYAAQIKTDPMLRENIVNLTLTDSRIMVYYHGYYILDQSTRENPELFYVYWNEFALLLKHPNSYHRDIGLTIIANLTPADSGSRFAELFDEYFSHIYDDKYMTACCCIQNAKKIIQNKKIVADKIIGMLMEHENRSRYTEKQEALLKSDILDILELAIENNCEDEKIKDFIMKSCRSISPKTKRKAKQLIEKWNLI